jgi:glycosyltransferase involved in cell wall biosynthesis
MPFSRYRFYSVIVASFNRIDEIKDLLASFEALGSDQTKYELIIVDDGSTDGTGDFLEKYIQKSRLPLRFVCQENKGPGAARNTGMATAGGDFFIFIDSDCSVPVHWLDKIDQALNNEQADAYGGPDTYREDFPALLKAINYSMTSFITTGGLRGRKGKKLAKFYPRSFNMGISRKLWEKIGGFGSLRHGQDIEFSNRILSSHAKVRFIPEAYVYHKRRTNIRRFYRQVYNWGVARINLYKLDPHMLEPLHIVPAMATLFVGAIIILAFFFDFFLRFLTAGFLLALVIQIGLSIDALRIYREIKPALLLPVIMPAQIFGYGLGFINNFIRRVILGKDEKVGFKRNYYK